MKPLPETVLTLVELDGSGRPRLVPKPQQPPPPTPRFEVVINLLLGLLLCVLVFITLAAWVVWELLYGVFSLVDSWLERIPLERLFRARAGQVAGTALFMLVVALLLWYGLEAFFSGAFQAVR